MPDVAEEAQRVLQMRERGRRAVRNVLAREQQHLAALRSRPALADPRGGLAERALEVEALRERARRTFGHRLDRGRRRPRSPAGADPRAVAAGDAAPRLRGLSRPPAARCVTDPAAVAAGDILDIRVADGRIGATVTTSTRSTEGTDDA